MAAIDASQLSPNPLIYTILENTDETTIDSTLRSIEDTAKEARHPKTGKILTVYEQKTSIISQRGLLIAQCLERDDIPAAVNIAKRYEYQDGTMHESDNKEIAKHIATIAKRILSSRLTLEAHKNHLRDLFKLGMMRSKSPLNASSEYRSETGIIGKELLAMPNDWATSDPNLALSVIRMAPGYSRDFPAIELMRKFLSIGDIQHAIEAASFVEELARDPLILEIIEKRYELHQIKEIETDISRFLIRIDCKIAALQRLANHYGHSGKKEIAENLQVKIDRLKRSSGIRRTGCC
ncbi:MAG: hypothetical protein K9M07_04755 [Simkaniaceae bacterium]|nr:hypothetical protein [Simkaniaceae bacterium]MCF7852532.1 hypothetical protein [Simkaniaceae bacterium]